MAAVLAAVAATVAGCGAAPRQAPATRRSQGPAVASTARAPGRLGAVAFTGPRRGYGLFVRTAGSRCQDQVARTGDGGARFTSLTAVVSWRCNGSAPAESLAADGASDAFLFGPRLFVTHDGGATWAADRLPGRTAHDVLAISAIGRSVWLLGTNCRAPGHPAATCRLVLLTSANGGRSWRPAPAQPPGALARTPFFAETGQSWLVRTGRRSGYVLSYPSVNPRGRPDRVPLWFTRNGGASWSRRSAPCGMDALYAAAAAAPGGALFVACAGEPGAGNQEKTTALSADGGRSWTLHASCPRRPMSCPSLSHGYLGEVAAPAGHRLFLGGPRSSLLTSGDGGARWTVVRPLIGDDGGGAFAITFFDRADGLVLGDDPASGEGPAIWHTSDGGARWRMVHPTVS